MLYLATYRRPISSMPSLRLAYHYSVVVADQASMLGLAVLHTSHQPSYYMVNIIPDRRPSWRDLPHRSALRSCLFCLLRHS